jgi:agmatine deiminase
MPAEWEPHEATWLAWPHHRADWPSRFGPIPWVYADIIWHLTQCETVRLLVQNGQVHAQARRYLRRRGVDLRRVDFLSVPTDRIWLRDSGPIFLRGPAGAVALLDWHFNAWAKYDNWQHDDAIPTWIANHYQIPHWTPVAGGRRVVLEGGSIDVNGEGLLLTTEECLLSPIQARNPHLSRQQIEEVLCAYLGVQKILWLDRGIAGDDTHGHVDDIARFVAPRKVVAVTEPNQDDPNHEPLAENLRRLGEMTDTEGRPLEVVTLPMPAPLFFRKQRLPASYANFYIASDRVLVPTFNDPADRIALGILADLFPGRTVVGIHSGDLVWGLGTLHCMSQQQPAVTHAEVD